MEYIGPDAFTDDESDMRIPLEADNIDKVELIKCQQREFPEEILQAQEDDSDYTIHGGILYPIRPVNKIAECYPRLMLPSPYRPRVIR